MNLHDVQPKGLGLVLTWLRRFWPDNTYRVVDGQLEWSGPYTGGLTRPDGTWLDSLYRDAENWAARGCPNEAFPK